MQSTYLIKLGEQGLLTIALPEMVGRYITVEQRDGQVVISPVDLDSAPTASSIAQGPGQTRFLTGRPGDLPVA